MSAIKKLPNPATGIIIDTLKHFTLSQSSLAKACHVSPGLISDILSGKKRISTELAIRLELALQIRAGLLLDLQQDHELATLRDRIQPKLSEEITFLVANH